MEYIRLARAIGGLISVISLVIMLIAEVIIAEATVSWDVIFLMVAMISTLLGVDILSQFNNDTDS